jgi:UDP-N-acetylmuramoylalanine--D-glutamate ligase
MIGDILKAAGLKVLVGGNLAPGRPVNELVLAADVDSVIVAEVSTFQLETVDSFRPFVGVITNITPDHLDRHPDFETYGRLKGRLLSKQGPEDTAVINGADPDVIRFAGKPMARTLLFNSGHAVTDGAWYDGQSLLMAKLGDSKTVMAASELRVPGRHNIENALAATAAASAFGVPRETMRQALAAFRGVPHRLEEVATVDGVRYINNSMCTNAAAGVQSLRALPGPLVVILGGKEKNTDLSPFLDEIAARARAAVLIGENRQRLARELGQRGLSAAVEADSLDAAVRAAAQAAAPGDVVILAPGCASYDMFRDFEDRGNQFKAAVLRLKDPGLHQQ